MTSYSTSDHVDIKIVNVTDGGNALYIDSLKLGDFDFSTLLSSVSDFEERSNLLLFPNPAQTTLTVKLANNNSQNNNEIDIINLVGERILQLKNINATETTLNTSQLLFYFNTLSTGFILSNMIMIPLSNILLQCLILLILIPTILCKMLHWGQIIEIFMQKMTQIVQYIFTISPQPIHFGAIPLGYLLAYYLIFLYLCVWKKRFNQPLFRFSTKTA